MKTKPVLEPAVEKRYFKEVDKLDDDTGYFDHRFVLQFLAQELSSLEARVRKEERERMAKEFVESGITSEYQVTIKELIEKLPRKEQILIANELLNKSI